jgi:hypothetical protein
LVVFEIGVSGKEALALSLAHKDAPEMGMRYLEGFSVSNNSSELNFSYFM